MRHVDFSPLYRSTVGFDRLFTMLDSLGQPEQAQTYPPYNIERTGENTYRITMAVAGFDETELSIEARAHVLTVKGEKADEAAGERAGDRRRKRPRPEGERDEAERRVAEADERKAAAEAAARAETEAREATERDRIARVLEDEAARKAERDRRYANRKARRA